MKNKLKIIKKLLKENDYNKSIVYSDLNDDFIEDEDLRLDIIIHIMKKNSDLYHIQHAKDLYDIIVFDKENKNQKELFFKFLSLYLNYIFSIKKFRIIYNIFKNKKLVLYLYTNCLYSDIIDLKRNIVYEYIIASKKYYIDETAHYFSILEFINEITKEKNIDLEKIMEKKLLIDKKIAGVNILEESTLRTALDYKNKISNSLNKINSELNEVQNKFLKLLEDKNNISQHDLIKIQTVLESIRDLKEEKNTLRKKHFKVFIRK